MQSRTKVLIVGAGPTGLSMAVELERFGIPFRIIDKHTKPVPTSNALVAHTRTLEVWDDLGLIDDALTRGIEIKGANFFANTKCIMHFNFELLNSYYRFVLGIAQHETETMLINNLAQKNISITMNTDLVDLIIQENAVDAVFSHSDGSQEIIHADWLVACDGGHSWVREKLRIPFVGKELPQHFVFADVEVHSGLASHELTAFTSSKGILLIAQFSEKYYRIIAEVTKDPELHKAKTLTSEQLKRLVKERCPFALELGEPIWSSGFWIHERMVENFQSGNVFLAGDAAHIHSPAGGQGMNTGIQDANNLAWKLALVIQGRSPHTILSSYNFERSVVAKSVLKNTTGLTSMISIRNPLLQFIRNMLLSWITQSKVINKKIVNTMTQLDIRYASNVVVKECMAGKPGPEAGMRMWDVEFDGKRLFDFVRGPTIVLLFFMGLDDGADVALFYDLKVMFNKKYPNLIKGILIRTQRDFGEWDATRIYDENGVIHQHYGAVKPCMYVIRPDKYIGFRGGIDHTKELKEFFSGMFFS